MSNKIFYRLKNYIMLNIFGKGSQRDVVYPGWPIAPSYTSPNARGGGGVAGSQPMSWYSCTHRAQINFVDLTPNLTYDLLGTTLESKPCSEAPLALCRCTGHAAAGSDAL
jgi:hypothetical protein